MCKIAGKLFTREKLIGKSMYAMSAKNRNELSKMTDADAIFSFDLDTIKHIYENKDRLSI